MDSTILQKGWEDCLRVKTLTPAGSIRRLWFYWIRLSWKLELTELGRRYFYKGKKSLNTTGIPEWWIELTVFLVLLVVISIITPLWHTLDDYIYDCFLLPEHLCCRISFADKISSSPPTRTSVNYLDFYCKKINIHTTYWKYNEELHEMGKNMCHLIFYFWDNLDSQWVF